jgi:hypothetical protein
MSLLSIEHSKAAYRADFALYALAVVALAGWLLLRVPHTQWLPLVACVLAGLGAWTGMEYALHRFVLHGLPPFSHWHVQHHQRPTALICAPTLVSGSLIGALVFLPALWASNRWIAGALTLGVLIGYLVYAVTHHATHHWRADHAWLARRKRWHARHHRQREGCYGVSTSIWDRVCGSAR